MVLYDAEMISALEDGQTFEERGDNEMNLATKLKS